LEFELHTSRSIVPFELTYHLVKFGSFWRPRSMVFTFYKPRQFEIFENLLTGLAHYNSTAHGFKLTQVPPVSLSVRALTGRDRLHRPQSRILSPPLLHVGEPPPPRTSSPVAFSNHCLMPVSFLCSYKMGRRVLHCWVTVFDREHYRISELLLPHQWNHPSWSSRLGFGVATRWLSWIDRVAFQPSESHRQGCHDTCSSHAGLWWARSGRALRAHVAWAAARPHDGLTAKPRSCLPFWPWAECEA
jgi:hypothetical protein